MEGIANFRFLRFLQFPLPLLSETSFWSHLAQFLRSKICQNPSQTGVGTMVIFWLLFFHDFDDFGVAWGVLGVPSGAPFSLHFCTFGGPGGKFAPARPFWGQFGWFFAIWAVFRCLFWCFVSVFLVHSVVFFPMILILIRATEEKLIDRAELIRWVDN